MTFQLDKVVPWGRNLPEYCAMFDLDEGDLASCILGCADGPASFNAELTDRGGHVVSADPLYRFRAEELWARIRETGGEVLAQTRLNQDRFVWNSISSIEELVRIRVAAMEHFLSDYDTGCGEGRYVAASLPALPFPDKAFAPALCSHFLFLYSELLDTDFHYSAIRELCRVAGEARIFPLLDLSGETSPHLAPVTKMLEGDGYAVSVRRVDYEFQKGGNQMMRFSNV